MVHVPESAEPGEGVVKEGWKSYAGDGEAAEKVEKLQGGWRSCGEGGEAATGMEMLWGGWRVHGGWRSCMGEAVGRVAKLC